MTINVTNVEPLKMLRITTDDGNYMRIWVEGESGTTYLWFKQGAIYLDNWFGIIGDDAKVLDVEMALPVSKYTVENAQSTLSDAAALRIELALLTESFNSLMETKQ